MACGSTLEEVELGFVEKPEDDLPLFPSKTGGKPVWLDPLNLPHVENLTCKKCGNPRVLLLQLYAPVDHLTNCYHRTVYVFCCKNPACHSRSSGDPFVVLRCNLPRVNPFYELENDGNTASKDKNKFPSVQVTGSKEDVITGTKTFSSQSDVNGELTISSVEDLDTEVKGLSLQGNEDKSGKTSINLPQLCVVCGCDGPKKCSRCHLINYCSREHQVIHWKSGHKRLCGEETCASAVGNNFGQTLFEEFEVVTEPEPSIQSSPEKSEAERMEEYHQFLELNSSRKLDTFNVDQASIDDVEKGMKKDKQFMIFRKRISLEPDQVISVVCNGMHTVCVCVRVLACYGTAHSQHYICTQ